MGNLAHSFREWRSVFKVMKENSGNQEKVKQVIESVTGEESKIIAVPSELIHFVGSLTSRGKTQKAVFLSQLIYWSDKGSRKDGFIFKTQREWKKETGLSESQVSTYTEEFESLELLETDLKKANGSPTVHYKLKIDVFLESFKEFLQNRNRDNREIQSKESDDSLTENTTQNTANISLSNKNSNFDREEENLNQESDYVDEVVLQIHGNTESNKFIHGFNLGEKILVPLNFAPTLDKQFRAVYDFPDKSPDYVTEKFIREFRQRGTRKTLFEWNNTWWDWMAREIPPRYSDYKKLDEERSAIINKVINKLYNAFDNYNKKVMHREVFHKKSEGYFSKFTIDKFLEIFVEENYYGCVEDYFFDLEEYEKSAEWKEAVDRELEKLGLSFYKV